MCTNNEIGYFFNPCMSAEVAIEVTNDGSTAGGEDLVVNSSSLLTMRMRRRRCTEITEFLRDPTFAVYTYIYPEYWYQNNGILTMEKNYCQLPRHSEEGYRNREDGWFELQALMRPM